MASKGLSPSSHFLFNFRFTIESAIHGAPRHAWRTSSRQEELPPPPLTEPYVKLSLHTAPMIQTKA